MPIYEYQCQSCGHHEEVMQRMSDDPLTVCPECGGPYKKLVSAPAFQFKGSGWYVTDYARKGGASSGGGSTSGGTADSGKTDGGKSSDSSSSSGSTSSGSSSGSSSSSKTKDSSSS